MDYKQKYLKYKSKYLSLQEQLGGKPGTGTGADTTQSAAPSALAGLMKAEAARGAVSSPASPGRLSALGALAKAGTAAIAVGLPGATCNNECLDTSNGIKEFLLYPCTENNCNCRAFCDKDQQSTSTDYNINKICNRCTHTAIKHSIYMQPNNLGYTKDNKCNSTILTRSNDSDFQNIKISEQTKAKTFIFQQENPGLGFGFNFGPLRPSP
jgi:hypothetical protein